jgi:TonB family protein
MGWAAGIPIDSVNLRRRELRRALSVSIVAHLVLLVMFVAAPFQSGPAVPPGVIAVDLVSLPGARPSPKSAPAVPPPAPAPKRKVVLPKETSQPKPAPKPRAEPKPAPAPEPEPAAEYTDVMAQLREELGESAAPEEQASDLAGEAGSASGGSVVVSPEVAAWVRRAKIHVRRNWVLTPGFRTQPLETHVSVRLDAGGRVLGEPQVTRRSGNPWYDDNVVRAVQKASPLPAPPEAGTWPFVFRPEDSY